MTYLQQVSFEPTAGCLVTNTLCATQQIFDRAYGNYLGVAQLGGFMAYETGMLRARLNVMVGIAKLERITKSNADFVPLVAAEHALVLPPVAPIAHPVVAAATAGATL